MNPILDGHYDIPFQLSENKADVIAIDLYVTSDIVETRQTGDSSKSRRIYQVYVNSITLPNGQTYSIEEDLGTNGKLTLRNYISDGYYSRQEIDIWPLSKETLCIFNRDILEKQSLKATYEPILIEIACLYSILLKKA